MPAKRGRKKVTKRAKQNADKKRVAKKKSIKAVAKPAARPAEKSPAARPVVARASLPGARQKRHKPTIQEIAEHEHQDPRGGAGGNPAAGRSHVDPRLQNYGAMRQRSVSRMDVMTNWFRKAAKPKQ